ncbi:hypothetical protein, partial [Chryseobacterium herbae]
STEELLDKHNNLNELKGCRRESFLKFLEIKVAGIKKVCIFAVRLNGEQKRVKIEVKEGLRLLKKL